MAGVTVWLAVRACFLAVLGVDGARGADGAIPVLTLVAFLSLFFLLDITGAWPSTAAP